MLEYPLNSLPIVVGVTGHRDIHPADAAALEDRVAALLLSIQKQYPYSPLIVLSSLAEGADRICARAARRAGCRLRVTLPMAREEYEKDFGPASRREFGALLAVAAAVGVASPGEDAPCGAAPGIAAPRGYFYRQAGLSIARQAHLLIALWDGRETSFPEGGGTYETVCFARREKIGVCHLPTVRGADRQAPGPRELAPRELGPQGASQQAPSSRELEKPPEGDEPWPRDSRLAAIDDFNRDTAAEKGRLADAAQKLRPSIIDEETASGLDGGPRRLLDTLALADALSLKYRALKLLTLRLLSLLGLLLVLSFLLYDELESDLMLFVYGAGMIAAGVIYRISSRRGFHAKYISYRALAEALRVQFYWTLGGIAANACDSYTYTQKSELDFVRLFLRALHCPAGAGGAAPATAGERAGEGAPDRVPGKAAPLTGIAPPVDAPGAAAPAGARELVWRFWIRGQYEYHRAAAAGKGKQDGRNNAAARWMLLLSVLLFVAVAAMEICLKGQAEATLPIPPILRELLLMHEGQQVLWRGALKLALGLVSAGAAFLANYYGGLALPGQIFDSQRLAQLFGADLPGGGGPLTDEQLLTLGREAIIESGGWYLAQKENAPSLFIG